MIINIIQIIDQIIILVLHIFTIFLVKFKVEFTKINYLRNSVKFFIAGMLRASFI